MRIISGVTGSMLYVSNHHPGAWVAPATKAGRQRLKWFDWHGTHGRNVSLTCRHFGISRQTFYRWQRRYDPRDLRHLDDRSSRPQRVRQPSWTADRVAAVKRLREQYPRWGKDKLVVLLAREGIQVSVAMVGRILSYLKRTGQLIEPLRRISARKRLGKRPYATRKPQEYTPTAPGDLVQLDTLDIRPEPGVVLKQFTARDVVSRWDVLHLASRATATAAQAALTAVLDRMPFAVRALQVDGGSEFMAGFEQACADRQIRLFVLPPHSPKLNGRVERANRTHTEEFYECSSTDPTVAALTPERRAWERVYNTVRPHQALAYQTPAEFLTTHYRDALRKEVAVS
ncbi:MAG TPA: helix-turn-helix domain-containing protein [Gemmatimonadales bacterium]|nr:helix-turn-helix domain-containing protein [Gemmatimonadales bacterium]